MSMCESDTTLALWPKRLDGIEPWHFWWAHVSVSESGKGGALSPKTPRSNAKGRRRTEVEHVHVIEQHPVRNPSEDDDASIAHHDRRVAPSCTWGRSTGEDVHPVHRGSEFGLGGLFDSI